MSAAAALIARNRARDTEAEPLTYTVLVAESALAALKEFAVLNASVVGNSLVFKTAVNLGVAVAIENPDELVVPVVHRASELSRIGLARTIGDLVTRARERRLTPDEVRGGTFTLTNPGIFGGTGGTPILHQPQVAILGLTAVTKRAVVINDAIAIRPMMSMSLTIDHRATDGMVAFRFLESLRRRIESVAE
jgi:pyruvate/2-oxoglutarate dehydrogenase complex dihydrolipoamide acyltransferase (E2) component